MKQNERNSRGNLIFTVTSGSNNPGIHPPLASFLEQTAFQDNEPTASWLLNLLERI